MQKKIIYAIALAIVVVLIVGLISDVRAFFRKNLVKFYTANFAYYDTFLALDGRVYFCAKNILSPQAGSINYEKEDFSFVEKGDVVASVFTNSGRVDVISQESGIFLKGFVNKEYNSFEEIFNSNENFYFTPFLKSSVRKNTEIGCVLITDDMIIRFPKNEYLTSKIEIKISPFVFADFVKVFENDKYVFYKSSQYLDWLIYSSKFEVYLGSIYGLKVPKSAIIYKNGRQYIYIVNGSVIKDIEVEIKQDFKDSVLIKVVDVSFNEFPSLIVVLTPRLFKVGEIVGSF